MTEMKFIREDSDGDSANDPSLPEYVYLNLSANVGDDQRGTFSGWVKPDVAEKVKAALGVTGDIRPRISYF